MSRPKHQVLYQLSGTTRVASFSNGLSFIGLQWPEGKTEVATKCVTALHKDGVLATPEVVEFCDAIRHIEWFYSRNDEELLKR